jgi:hypothetical protein
MKKLLLGVSLAALAVPAFAADPVVYYEQPAPIEARDPFSGHVEGYLGGVRFDADFGDAENAWVFGGNARANYALTDRWNVQGDLFGESVRFDGIALDTLGAGGHVYWRDPNSFAAGVFASATSIGSVFSLKEYLVGPEAQVYFGNFTLYGQAYFGQISADFPFFPDIDVWGGRAIARYFVHDDFRIQGEVGYRQFSQDSFETDNWTFAAQADYRFTGSPFSVFGRYQYDTFSSDAGAGELDAHKVLVGLRGTFGAETLKAEDRFGATMELPRGTLPVFGTTLN